MKLLRVSVARVIYLFNVQLVNPVGLALHGLLPALARRYEFESYPSSVIRPEDAKGYQFRVGSFTPQGKDPIAVNFTVHDDGMVVETRSSTADGDEFFRDAMHWLAEEFRIVPLDQIPYQKAVASELVVQAERPLPLINPRLRKWLAHVAELLGTDHPRDLQAAHLVFTPPNSQQPNPPQFRVEPELATAPNEHRYYSFANLDTHLHLSLLEELEGI